MRVGLRGLALAGVAALALVVSSGAVNAANINYSGTATGVFGNGLTTFGGLTYIGSTWSCTTDASGFCAVGGTGQPPGGPANVDNFGSFTVDLPPGGSFTGGTFTLSVNFSTPPGVAPNPGVYNAILNGTVTTNGTGGVSIIYSNPTINYTASTGPFSLKVNDVSVASPDAGSTRRTVAETGNINDTPRSGVPEPTTNMMLGGGLTALALLLRKVKK
jgi:hypothetical protein